MSTLAFPIFVVEGLDINTFESLDEVERWLEPWWVEEALGTAYDAQGRLIELKAGSRKVTIEGWESEPQHAKELELLLRSFLNIKNNNSGEDIRCDLHCLVEVCQSLLKNAR